MNDENMRVRVTKRMLREGLLRCLKHTSIDKLSVSELCRESGVNRATFYNHYEIPKDILHEMSQEFSAEIKSIFEADPDGPVRERVTACLETLLRHRENMKIELSSGADRYLAMVSSEIFMWTWSQRPEVVMRLGLKDQTEYELVAAAFSEAAYQLVKKWLTEDIRKTPSEIADIMMTVAEKLLGDL